jgi:hypothetical protein
LPGLNARGSTHHDTSGIQQAGKPLTRFFKEKRDSLHLTSSPLFKVECKKAFSAKLWRPSQR